MTHNINTSKPKNCKIVDIYFFLKKDIFNVSIFTRNCNKQSPVNNRYFFLPLIVSLTVDTGHSIDCQMSES